MGKYLLKPWLVIFVFTLFYLLNAHNNFFPLVEIGHLLLGLIFFYCVGILIYLSCLLILKNKQSALILSLLLQLFVLFYGVIYDQVSIYFPLIARHSVLCIAYAVLCILLLILLSKVTIEKRQQIIIRNTIIFVALTIFELGRLALLVINQPSKEAPITSSSNQAAKPDIYLLVMDEYSSTEALSCYFNMDNRYMDSFLLQSGFYIFPKSKSNYMRTTFSVASILNFDYVNGLQPSKNTNTNDIILSLKKIKFNRLYQLLEQRGYRTVNYSNFDIYKNPSATRQTFRLFNDRLLTANTLMGRLTTDLGWNVRWPLLKNLLGTGDSWQTFRDINERTIQKILAEPSLKTSQPKFVYTHLFMPHPPFLYDSLGRLNEEKYFSIDKHYAPAYVPLYLSYLHYTNKKLMEIIRTIQLNTNNKAVIILTGDHGYRVRDKKLPDEHFFANMQAVFFPNRDYEQCYPSASPINAMRIVGNKFLGTNYPLLKDSSIKLGETW